MSSSGMTSAPLLSVVIITFNHERFIRQTLESVLEQRTEFPIEVIVADDASTDRTPQIINEIAERHPEVRPILRRVNVGIHANLISALEHTKGAYVALCEGDDYWTDPTKLSKQVRFMQDHPATSLCFHPVRVLWEDLDQSDELFPSPELVSNLTLDALLAGNFIQTNSVVYRRLARYDDVPEVMPLDWYLHVRHAMVGEIRMLPDPMATYRRHPGGVWYESITDRAKFWSAQGSGHAALCEALLDLFHDDPAKRAIIASTAARVLGELARLGDGDHAAPTMLDVMTRHPRWAELAIARQASDYAKCSDELAAVLAKASELNANLANAREHIERQRERIQKQRGRIESLRARLDRRTTELEDARARLPRERIRRALRRSMGSGEA